MLQSSHAPGSVPMKNGGSKPRVDDRMCLTLHQPLASLMAYGLKRVEGRVWHSDYTGNTISRRAYMFRMANCDTAVAQITFKLDDATPCSSLCSLWIVQIVVQIEGLGKRVSKFKYAQGSYDKFGFD